MLQNKTIKDELEKDVEKESEDDPSPKKVASDDEEGPVDDVVDPLENNEESEDDPLSDFMPEEESW